MYYKRGTCTIINKIRNIGGWRLLRMKRPPLLETARAVVSQEIIRLWKNHPNLLA